MFGRIIEVYNQFYEECKLYSIMQSHVEMWKLNPSNVYVSI